MKQVNDATKIIKELIAGGHEINTIASYCDVTPRAILHWKNGYRMGFKMIENDAMKTCWVKVKIPTGPSDESFKLVKKLIGEMIG